MSLHCCANTRAALNQSISDSEPDNGERIFRGPKAVCEKPNKLGGAETESGRGIRHE